MHSDEYIKVLQDALSSDKTIRQQAEQRLKEAENDAEFLHTLLQIVVSNEISAQIRVNGAIYLKNKITQVWLSSSAASTSVVNQSVRKELCSAIHSVNRDVQLRKQLTEALYKILVIDDWPELADVSLKFLSSSDFSEVFTGLLLSFQAIKAKRWSRAQDAHLLNEYSAKLFPQITPVTENIVEHLNSGDPLAMEALYLSLKIFKYATYVELPPYFKDVNNLGKWIQIKLHILSSPVPQYIMALDEDERDKDFRVRSIKWSYGNLHRLQYKYGGGINSKETETEFTTFFNTNFVPVILETFWKEIASWSQKEKWLSESSLYHMIAFLESCCSANSSWALVREKMDAIFTHLIFPSLEATNESLELYETDPEEYYRRYLDVNREIRSADVGAINFVFNLCFKRFGEMIQPLLALLNETFTKRSTDYSNLDYAKASEAALRILSSVSFKIVKKGSPVAHQIDDLINSFVVPELGEQNKFQFLKARACDVIAAFSYTYKNVQVLSSIYEGCMSCFQNSTSDSLPLLITSADALGTLIAEAEVEKAIEPHVNAIMEKLLTLSNQYEFDVINSIMDDFVEKFALKLEPFSVAIASNLNQQLIKISNELLESGNVGEGSSDTVEKEYQGVGILNTMMTMLLSMTSSKDITLALFKEMAPSIRFVMENGLVGFINEVIELLETCNITLKEISPLMWQMFELTLESFETFGADFFEVYVPFLESCINFGFKDKSANDPHVAAVLSIISNNIESCSEDSYNEYSVELSFELFYQLILTANDLSDIVPGALRKATAAYLESDESQQSSLIKPYLKFMLSCSCRYPIEALKAFQDQEILQLFGLWLNNDNLMTTTFDVKLQIMVIINLLKMIYSNHELPPSIVQSESVLKVKVISCLQRLPAIVAKQQEILAKQAGKAKEFDESDYNEDFLDDPAEDEYDEDEIDAYKDILFDNLNVYDEFVNGFLKTGNIYNQFIQGISDPELINVVNQCISAVQ